MRIALLASGFADYSLELAGALTAHHQVAVWADRPSLARERGDAASPPGVEVRSFSQAHRMARWAGVVALASAMARWRPDAILAHEHPHPHLTALLTLLARVAPIGLIVHDPEAHPGRDTAFASLRAKQTAAQRSLASRLFTHGVACSERLRQATGRAVDSFPHGPILRPSTPPPAPPGEGRVLMFGRMEAYKGLEVLLEAGRRLNARGARVQFELLGAGPELERLAPQFRALSNCRLQTGYASRDDLLHALAACDVVVAPYLHASGSGVAAAALANGRGLVASAIGGLTDVVRPGVNGLLAPPGDSEALAYALEQALGRSRELARGASDLAAGPFAWRDAAGIVAAAMAAAARTPDPWLAICPVRVG